MDLQSQIDQFMEFTGGMCDRRTAEDFIRGNDSFERAVQAFFDDPSPLKYREARTWNEGSFTSGRDAARSQMDELPPYQMDEDDRESRSQLRALGAPSRPPSREKSRVSLRSGRDVDMQVYGPHPQNDDDAQMREAIRLSMEDQQTGIIGASGREYVPNLDLRERVRQPGEPAFLKPLPSNNFLPALVTILHTISQCREMFLSRYDLLMDYGEDKRWWDGESIEITRIIDPEISGDGLDQMDVLHETQRLMAFLDGTDRSYGSAGALAHLNAVQKGPQGALGNEPLFVNFMRAWQAASDRSRTAYTNEYPFRSTIQAAPDWDKRSLYCVDIGTLDIPDGPSTSLYDILDNCFWPNNPSSTSSDECCLTQIAPIMVMRLAPRKTASGNTTVAIPAVLFADRYLEENKNAMRLMRAELSDHYAFLGDLDDRLGDFDLFQHPCKSTVGSASKLLYSAIDIMTLHHNEDAGWTSPPRNVESEVNGAVSMVTAEQVLSRLQQIHEQLRAEVQSITQDQKAVKDNIQKLKSLLTDPTLEDSRKPIRSYSLLGVGVATTNQSHITYIKHSPSEPQLVDIQGAEPLWWRISYDTAGDKALVTKEQIFENTVREAAGELLYETLLVYASEDMLVPGSEEPLPYPLQEFVALDNAALRNELERSPSPVDINIIEGKAIEFDGPGPAMVPNDRSFVPDMSFSPPTPPRPPPPRPQADTTANQTQVPLAELDPALSIDVDESKVDLGAENSRLRQIQKTRQLNGSADFVPVNAKMFTGGDALSRSRGGDVEQGEGDEHRRANDTDSDSETETLVGDDKYDNSDTEMGSS